MIRALIVDDEPIARETLRLGLVADPEVEVVGDASGAEAVALVTASRPDLLFLDVQMPGMDGFEVLEAIGPGAVPAVVFVTAYDRYALKAFEVHALDYLVKPFDDRRFVEMLARAEGAAQVGTGPVARGTAREPARGARARRASIPGALRGARPREDAVRALRWRGLDPAAPTTTWSCTLAATPTSSGSGSRISRHGSTLRGSCASIARRS